MLKRRRSITVSINKRKPEQNHRTTLNPRTDTQRKMLRMDRFYIHVYQTKIGPDRRTLRSKEIARELGRRLGRLFWPRDAEKKESERRNAEQRNWVKKKSLEIE